MIVLNSRELTSMRDAVEDLMPDFCNLLTLTIASDGQGGGTQTWGTAYAAVKCRLDYVSGLETNRAGALNPFTGWVLTVPQSQTITAAYRVEHSSNTYTVQSVSEGGSWLACKRAWLQRLM
jgi:head-tail adaptor